MGQLLSVSAVFKMPTNNRLITMMRICYYKIIFIG